MNDHDHALADMRANLRAAQTETCALSWARRIAAIEIDRNHSGFASEDFLEALAQVISDKERNK